VVTSGRSYRQQCGIARALDLVGERWALLVVRELVLGPKRFTDLRAGLPGIATNVLTQRLQELERDGIITRRTLPPPAASSVYELTEYGRDLVPIMLDLGRWGSRTLGTRPLDYSLRSEWLGVALRAFFEPQAAQGFSGTIVFHFEDGAFTVRLDDGRLEVTSGAAEHADLRVTADPQTLVAYLAGASPEAALEAEGDLDMLARLPLMFSFTAREATVVKG
jgi:DNA-binding HxlR family transcriptional regulator